MNVIIALGGNVGAVLKHFIYARSTLNAMNDCTIMKSSSLYTTPALGPEGQGDYLNAVVSIETTCPSLVLLPRLHAIEHACDRRRTVRWGPRTLDLDIIDYAGKIYSDSTLTLPHPEVQHRAFVLLPLADIIPHWLHPISKIHVQDLLLSCDRQGIQCISSDW